MRGLVKSQPKASVSLAPNKGGRPPKLHPDEATLKVVRGLGNIQATTKECAAFFSVSEPTYLKFKRDHPQVAEAFDEGVGHGRISLRRKQFALADNNASMAIFLGKNYLGQADRQEFEHSGGLVIEIVKFGYGEDGHE